MHPQNKKIDQQPCIAHSPLESTWRSIEQECQE